MRNPRILPVLRILPGPWLNYATKFGGRFGSGKARLPWSIVINHDHLHGRVGFLLYGQVFGEFLYFDRRECRIPYTLGMLK